MPQQLRNQSPDNNIKGTKSYTLNDDTMGDPNNIGDENYNNGEDFENSADAEYEEEQNQEEEKNGEEDNESGGREKAEEMEEEVKERFKHQAEKQEARSCIAATWELWAPVSVIIIAIIAIFLLAGILRGVGEGGEQETDISAPGFGDVQGPSIPAGEASARIVAKAKYYVHNESAYKKDRLKAFTDCGGFVATVLRKSGVDPNFQYGGRVKDQIWNYIKSRPKKYEILTENLKDTSQLQPGDILLNYKHGSHIAIFVGNQGDPGKNIYHASLRKHGPEADNWYSDLHVAIRIKG